jgi:hypothetical protein
MPTMHDITDQPTDHDNNNRPTTDQVATDHRPTTADHPPDPVPATLDEAATTLGISPNAVRQRLKRGTLTGEKTAGGWVVWLPADQATTGVTGWSVTDQPPTTDRPTGDRPRPTSDAGVDLGPLAELIASQGDEIGRLRETAAIWQIRAMQAEERLKQLTAGETSESPPQTRATAAPEGQGATIRSARGQPPGAWWRRWLGLTR